MMDFIVPENREKFLILKAKEEAMLRQYEYNINMSRTMLINSNAKFKDQVNETIKSNEADLEGKLNVYQKKMMLAGSEIMDKIILADDYQHLSDKMNDIQLVILEEFVQKYKTKLEKFLTEEERKTGNYYNVIKQRMETLILGKMSKIKKIESTYIENIKAMYRDTMDELTTYKENGMDVIVIEKKCLRKDHFEEAVLDMKEQLHHDSKQIIDTLMVVNKKYELLEQRIDNQHSQITSNSHECCCNHKETVIQDVDWFVLPLDLKYSDPVYATLDEKKFPKIVCVSPNKQKQPISAPLETKECNLLCADRSPTSKRKPNTLNHNTSFPQSSVLDFKPPKEHQIEQPGNIPTIDSKALCLDLVKTIIPNYNHLLQIDTNYAKFFEITPLITKHSSKFKNWREYVKCKITMMGYEKNNMYKTLFEYTHKLCQWIEQIKETIESKIRITLPKADLNKEEHWTEALGVGYVYDDDDDSLDLQFDSDGCEIDSD